MCATCVWRRAQAEIWVLGVGRCGQAVQAPPSACFPNHDQRPAHLWLQALLVRPGRPCAICAQRLTPYFCTLEIKYSSAEHVRPGTTLSAWAQPGRRAQEGWRPAALRRFPSALPTHPLPPSRQASASCWPRQRWRCLCRQLAARGGFPSGEGLKARLSVPRCAKITLLGI